MDYVFSFNGRMLAILAVVQLMLLAACFGLGMLFGEHRGAVASGSGNASGSGGAAHAPPHQAAPAGAAKPPAK